MSLKFFAQSIYKRNMLSYRDSAAWVWMHNYNTKYNVILIIWFNFLYFLEESEYRYFIKVNFDIQSMLSCVDIHWSDKILCNFIYSQWFDGLKANALGLILVLVLQLMICNNEIVCHLIRSDLIRFQPIHFIIMIFRYIWESELNV